MRIWLILAMLAGACAQPNEESAATKYSPGGNAPPSTYYVLTATQGTHNDGSPAPRTETFFITQINIDHATGEAEVNIKTMDRRQNISNDCTQLELQEGEQGELKTKQGPRVEAKFNMHTDSETGAQSLSVDVSGKFTDASGKQVTHNIVDSQAQITAGLEFEGNKAMATDMYVNFKALPQDGYEDLSETLGELGAEGKKVPLSLEKATEVSKAKAVVGKSTGLFDGEDLNELAAGNKKFGKLDLKNLPKLFDNCGGSTSEEAAGSASP